MEWLTRNGEQYKPRTEIKSYAVSMLGAPPVQVAFTSGAPYDIDLNKGTAKYNYEAPCDRCGGAGGSMKWAHTGWTCFDCGGSGKGKIAAGKLYTAEKLARLNDTQAKRDAARATKAQRDAEAQAAAAQVARGTFYQANKELVDRLASWAEAYGAGNAEPNAFLLDMWQKLEAWGSLTTGQIEASRAALDRMDARKAARAASQYVGEIGQRLCFTLTIEKVIDLVQEHYGWAASSIYLCKDDQGNRVVYKGAGSFGRKGETVKVKATVAGHDVYRDEQQTSISRPKVLGILDPESGKFMVWDSTSSSLVEASL